MKLPRDLPGIEVAKLLTRQNGYPAIDIRTPEEIAHD